MAELSFSGITQSLGLKKQKFLVFIAQIPQLIAWRLWGFLWNQPDEALNRQFCEFEWIEIIRWFHLSIGGKQFFIVGLRINYWPIDNKQIEIGAFQYWHRQSAGISGYPGQFDANPERLDRRPLSGEDHQAGNGAVDRESRGWVILMVLSIIFPIR